MKAYLATAALILGSISYLGIALPALISADSMELVAVGILSFIAFLPCVFYTVKWITKQLKKKGVSQ